MSFLLSKKQIPHLLLSRPEKDSRLALGETLPPSALPLLQSIGLLKVFEEQAIRKTTGYHSAWGSDRVSDHNFYFNHPFRYGLKLDKERLLETLGESQKDYIREFKRLSSVTDDSTEVTVVLDDNTKISARYLVDATGRKRVVTKALGIADHDFDNLVAFSAHVPKIKMNGLPHGVYVEPFETGWGIVSELSETTSVMTLFTTKNLPNKSDFTHYKNWAGLIENTKHLKSFLSPDKNTRVVGGKANSSRVETFAGKNWLALGDAAMAFDPLSSHGITSGIYTANQAALAIEKDLELNDSKGLETYANRLEKVFGGYLSQKGQLYHQEKRWATSLFWKELHQTGR